MRKTSLGVLLYLINVVIISSDRNHNGLLYLEDNIMEQIGAMRLFSTAF